MFTGYISRLQNAYNVRILSALRLCIAGLPFFERARELVRMLVHRF